jgi:hypothetical protein
MKRICVDGVINFFPVAATVFADLVKRHAPDLPNSDVSFGLDCK